MAISKFDSYYLKIKEEAGFSVRNGIDMKAINLKERAKQLKTDIPAMFLSLKRGSLFH